MAFNMDAALRIAAKVQGLNDFKALAERLLDVEKASGNSKAGFQQLTAESARLANENVRAAASARAQGVALQELGVRSRASAGEMRRSAGEAQAFGGVLQRLRGQSAGVVDGIGQSAGKAANNIRELNGALAPTDQQLAEVRSEMLALEAASTRTERSLAQQIAVLKNLRSQADANGAVYQELSEDIKRLALASKELGPATEPGIRGLKMLAKASLESTNQQVRNTSFVRAALLETGDVYRRLGRDIDNLRQKAASLDLSKGLQVTPASVAKGVGGTIRDIVRMRQDLSRSMTGRVVLTGEGLAAAGAAGAVGMGAASGLGGLANSAQAVSSSLEGIAAKASELPALLKPLGGLLSEPAAAAAASAGQWASSLSAAQAKLQALAVPLDAIKTAIAAIGPEWSAAYGGVSMGIALLYQTAKRQVDEERAELEASFKGLTDSAQKVLQDLVRIYDKVPNARLEAQQALRERNAQLLGEAPAGSLEARRAANAVVTAEREIAKIQGAQNALLDQARQRENASADALAEQLQIGRSKVQVAREELALAERVAQVQRQAADRRRQAADAAAADQLRRDAAAAFPRSSVLALPAAGGTSAPGTGQAMSGGARLLRNYETAGTRDPVGAPMGSLPQALQQAQAVANGAKGTLRELFIEVSKSTQASNGSINSLQRQRAAWQALQNAVNPAAPAYERARRNAERLDEQIKKLTTTQEKAARAQRGGGREAFGGALGALAAGGGFQGAAGALAGSLAFSGGPAGIAAGAAITGIGAAGALAARVGVDAETAQARLKALTEQFGEYNQAQAAAARIAATLRISQIEAADGLSKLYAALRPTGVTLQEVEDAFIGFTAAARASGSTATESSAALLQLKQALGSGVLQGDELRSIREQAPAAAQAIAKEMGVTVGELKKLGSEGKITTDIVLRALARLKGESLGKLNAQFATSGQAMKDLQVAAEEFGTTIAQVFGPTAVGLVKGFTEAVKRLNDATFAFRSPTAATAREIIQSGRLPGGALPQSVLMQGAGELFKGSSGAGGVGITGLRKEAEQLAKLRKQPVNDVLFELMKNRLGRVDSQQTASAGQLAEQQSAAREREAGRARAAAASAPKVAAKEAADTANRLAEESAKARIELDNTLHQNAIELIRKRYEFERELQDRSADNWVKRYTGAARGAAGIISGALRGFDELAGRQREADVGILNARQALSSSQRQGAIGAAGVTGFTASQLQSATKEAGRFTGIANMCSESVKAFYKSLGITLPGVTAWADTVRKAGKTMTDWSQLRAGDIVATGRPGDTPHVGVYTGGDSVFHQSRGRGLKAGNYPDLNYFKQGGYFVRPSAMAGTGAGPAAAGDTMQATANLAQAKALAALEKGQIEKLKTSIGEGFVLDFTDQLKLQNAELVNQNAITQLRNRLQMEGVRPEIIEAEAQKAQRIREVAEQTGVASEKLAELTAAGQGSSEQANKLREGMGLLNDYLLTFKTRTDEATAAQIAFNDAIRFRQDSNVGAGLREGAQGYIESIGTMREATAQLAQSGIGGIENALTSLATTGKANFREFAVDMLEQTARMIIQQMVLRTVLQAVGAIGGAAAGGGGGITGNIGSVNFNPAAFSMPSFDGGGYTGNRPKAGGLDGRGGFMAMLHPRETVVPDGRGMGSPITVMVNVDAKGTAVESNQTEGAQLGRAISAAVQAELVKQQRPGGLLAGTRR